MSDLLKVYDSDDDNDEGKLTAAAFNPHTWIRVPSSLPSKTMISSNMANDAHRADKRRRMIISDPISSEFSGPWGGFDEDKTIKVGDTLPQPEKACGAAPARQDALQDAQSLNKFAILHDTSNSSWIEPRNTSPPSSKSHCHLPKKLVHTWRGHTAGVQRIRLFPGYGHLLLSCSLDGTVKIWDCQTDRKCKQTYTGHSQAVKDIQFTHGGRRFYSAGFDTIVRLWDTEPGPVISTLTDDTLAFCLAVHPENFDSVVVGTQSKKAVQFDASSGKVVQQYAGHQGSVSFVSFVEEGRKLITSSDDRKLFTWVYGIPVIDRYIAEPTMHSIPAIAIHPSNKFMIGQSMNNTIVVYQAGGDFKYQSNRKFLGHANAGYAIQPGFSPDGRFVTSGGSDGSLHFWDWKTSNLYRSMKAHEGVCMDSVWHPIHPSKVFSCGWDGLVKLWE